MGARLKVRGRVSGNSYIRTHTADPGDDMWLDFCVRRSGNNDLAGLQCSIREFEDQVASIQWADFALCVSAFVPTASKKSIHALIAVSCYRQYRILPILQQLTDFVLDARRLGNS